MSVCDSEENRKKLAWLVPGYILLAWFFCVLFQPLGIHTPPSSSSSSKTPSIYNYHHDTNYEVVYLDADSSAQLCDNGVLKLEEGSKSAMILRVGRGQHLFLSHTNFATFNCSIQVQAGKGLDGVVAVVEEMVLADKNSDVGQPGGHWGSSECVDYVEMYSQLNTKNKFAPIQRNKLCGSWKMIGNEGITSHGTQKLLIGYCYDTDLEGPDHSCGTNHININTIINSNVEVSRRYNSNDPNHLRNNNKGFSIVVTGYKNPKKIKSLPKKHNNPSVARMQTQWASGVRSNSKQETSEKQNKYAHFLFPSIPHLFDLSSNTNTINPEKPMSNDKAEEKHYKKSNWDPERKVTQYFSDAATAEEEGSGGCSDNEFMCQVTEFSSNREMIHSNRCIWKRLKCDYHQNCGFTYNNDEINCSLSGFDEGDTIGGDGGVNGNPIPWSISTMSLLIIIYLAIVLILVLVTMLLLRWHRALRTPLEVLSESRYTSALGRSIDGVTTVASTPHGFQSHGYGELTITSTNLEAALAEVENSRSGDMDGAIAGIEGSASGRTPGTVSIMVMYRPQKSPKVPLAATELPPSYDSLFREENPPNYSRIENTVNLPTLEEQGLNAAENDTSNDPTNAITLLPNNTFIAQAVSSVRNATQTNINRIISGDIIPSSTPSCHNRAETGDIIPSSVASTNVQENHLPCSIDGNGMAISSNECVSLSLHREGDVSGCENSSDNNDEIVVVSSAVLIPGNTENSTNSQNIEDHCQCDCDHTNCNSDGN